MPTSSGRFGLSACSRVPSTPPLRPTWRWEKRLIQSSAYGLISSLVAKSLVVADTSQTPTEYRLLDTTRAYARMKLAASRELPQAAARHAARTTQILASSGAELEVRSKRDWLEYFNRKLDDVRAALDWSYSADGDPAFAAPLTLAAAPVWAQLDLYDEAKQRIEAAMQVVKPDSQEEMRLCDSLSVALTDVTNERARAEAAALRAIILAQRLADRPAELRAQFSLWNTHISGGAVSAALDDLRRFSALADSLGGAFEAVVKDRMACVTKLVAGDLAGARAAIDRVLARSPARDARKKLAWFAYEPDIGVGNTQASLLWLEGKSDSAIAAIQENLARAMAVGNQAVMASVLADIACPIALSVGDLETAERHLAHLDMVVALGGPPNFRAWAGVFRATLAATRGDGSAALALLSEGLPADADHPRFTSMLTELALRLGRTGAVEPARRLADRLLHRAEGQGELWIWSEVQRVRGELNPDEGAAVALFEAALQTARMQGARAWGLRAATSLATLQPHRAGAVLAPWLAGVKEGRWTGDVLAANAILQRRTP